MGVVCTIFAEAAQLWYALQLCVMRVNAAWSTLRTLANLLEFDSLSERLDLGSRYTSGIWSHVALLLCKQTNKQKFKGRHEG